MGDNEEEYELVPVSPIRRMERRMGELEKMKGGGEINKELLDMARINQEVVDDLVKTNSKLATKMAEMIDSVEKLTEKISAFIDRVEVVGEEPSASHEHDQQLNDKLGKLEKRLNALIVSRASPRPMTMSRPAPRPF
ncbi:MAG: hypothetical protein ABIG30_00510 [Candidatus Aenigmatarchaeota archaeon]